MMIVIEQTRQFKQFQIAKNHQRQTRQLATYLITSLFIDPKGQELSAIITPTNALDNTEFVLSWVRQEVCCISCLQDLDFTALQRDFVRWLLNHDVPVGELQ